VGDRVGVNKLVYGPRVPFMSKRIFHLGEPKRWDIIVFSTPQPNALHKTLVKRVVGLPGERIHIADGKIWVNGASVEPPESLRNVLHYTDVLGQDKAQVERFILQLAKHKGESPLLNPVNFTVRDFYAQLAKIREQVGDRDPATLSQEEVDKLLDLLSPVSRDIGSQLFAMQQAVQYPLRYGILPDDQYSIVPANCYLVCGDNSPDSADGRYFGWLPNDNILGRAFCIMWPISRWRDFTGFSQTWWGRGILYGLPAILVILECSALIRKRGSRRRSRPA
jgi:signal peptidase I